MKDIIRAAFERQTESLYEGNFAKHADGDYVNEVQQYQFEGYRDGWNKAVENMQLEIDTLKIYKENFHYLHATYIFLLHALKLLDDIGHLNPSKCADVKTNEILRMARYALDKAEGKI